MADVVGLDGAPAEHSRKVAGVREVLENCRNMTEVAIVARDHEGKLHVYGSMESPAEALWALRSGELWLLSGGTVVNAQPAPPEEA